MLEQGECITMWRSIIQGIELGVRELEDADDGKGMRGA